MVRHLVLLVVLSSIASHVDAEPSRVPLTTIPLRLVHSCASSACLHAPVIHLMQRETEQIWSLLDVRLAWIDSMYDPAALASGGWLTVILEERPLPQTFRDRSVLGVLDQPADRCRGGLARIWVDGVRTMAASVKVNGTPFDSLPNALANVILARGLGRALAHEVGHYLLGTAHSPTGLMRANLAPFELFERAGAGRYGVDSRRRAALASCP